MMCHSIEVARYMLTKPGEQRSSIRPIKVSAQIASLKWSLPEYAKRLTQTMGTEVDYQNKPAEDFARATELAPNYPDVYFSRCLLNQRREEYPVAIEDCSKALKLKPDYTDAYLARGAVRARSLARDPATIESW